MSVEKQARSRAKDPVQEKIRNDKDLWNKACSALISKLIAFKKGFNGRGDAKAGLAPSRITEPLPSEVVSLISELAGKFSELAQAASGIAEEQSNYANSRIQAQPKIASLNPELLSYGSNALTRFWAHLKGRISGGPLKTERLSMLTLCANIKKDCLDFQAQIVSSGRDSVEKASTIFHKIDLQLKALDSYAKLITNQDSSNEEINSNLADLFTIKNDLLFALKVPQFKGSPNIKSSTNQIILSLKKYEKEKDEFQKHFFLEEIKSLYANFLGAYVSTFKSIYNINQEINSFKDAYEFSLKNDIPQSEHTNEPIDDDKSFGQDEIKFIIQDLILAVKLPRLNKGPNNRESASQIINVIRKFENEKDLLKKEFFFEEARDLYNRFLKEYATYFKNSLYGQRIYDFDKDAESFEEMFDFWQELKEQELAIPDDSDLDEEKTAKPNYDFEKYAANEFMLWLKNKLKKLNPMHSDSSIRVNIFETTNKFLEHLNSLMNMLEKEIEPNLFKNLLIKLNEQDQKIEEQFLILDQMTSIDELKDPDTISKLKNLVKRKRLRQMSTGF